MQRSIILRATLALAALTASGSLAAAMNRDTLATKASSPVAACKYYKYWTISGGNVICYGKNGDNCAVCDQPS